MQKKIGKKRRLAPQSFGMTKEPKRKHAYENCVKKNGMIKSSF